MKKKNLDIFIESSAKTGDNIKEIFNKSALEIIEKNLKVKELK